MPFVLADTLGFDISGTNSYIRVCMRPEFAGGTGGAEAVLEI
jgi:hypothetical protein